MNINFLDSENIIHAFIYRKDEINHR
jgi:hypothetical protein